MCRENNYKPDRFLSLTDKMAQSLAFEESQRATSFVLIPHKYHQNKETYVMEHHPFRSRRANKRVLIALITVLFVATLVAVVPGLTRHGVRSASAITEDPPGGLGQLSGLLPRDHLTEESAIQVNLSTETVRLPLYKGEAYGKTAWFLLLDASDAGLAHDLGVNYAPKLADMAISCPTCVQTVTLDSPTPAQNPFGPALVHFQGAPDFSPTRIAVPGPNGFPLAKFQPGAVAGPGYSPFIQIAGSPVVYNAPIVATGNGPFDVVHHTNTEDRVLGIHIAGKSKPGQFAESWVDILFVKGFDAGQPILYLSTDAGQPLTAVLERSVYVPALNNAAFNGRDLLNVFGDLPTLKDPRHADAYSPLWDAQLGLWTPKAIKAGLNTRQIDENVVFNLAATRPDLLTGVNPATGQPEPYGSVGVDINCAVIGFTANAPTVNLAPPAPHSQFEPR